MNSQALPHMLFMGVPRSTVAPQLLIAADPADGGSLWMIASVERFTGLRMWVSRLKLPVGRADSMLAHSALQEVSGGDIPK
jgi:hypothetical protein